VSLVTFDGPYIWRYQLPSDPPLPQMSKLLLWRLAISASAGLAITLLAALTLAAVRWPVFVTINVLCVLLISSLGLSLRYFLSGPRTNTTGLHSRPEPEIYFGASWGLGRYNFNVAQPGPPLQYNLDPPPARRNLDLGVYAKILFCFL
jgi:hypothetical protein